MAGPRIAFFGTPPFAATCLEQLIESGFEIVAVVSRPQRPAGRGQKLRPTAVASLAREKGLPLFCPQTLDDDFKDNLATFTADIGVVVAYGRLLPRAVFDLPPHGCINAHASLLPALRGAAPIERALLAGMRETGVTLIRLVERMDAGDIIASVTTAIEPNEDAGHLRQRLALVSARLLTDTLPLIVGGRATFTPQAEDQATYAPAIDKSEARIDWTRAAIETTGQVRAFSPKPGAFTFAGRVRLKVLAASVWEGTREEENRAAEAGEVIGCDGDLMLVACGASILAVSSLQPEGRRPMTAADYLRGQASAGHGKLKLG